jgi:cell filamentation protein
MKQSLDALFTELTREDRLKNLDANAWTSRAAYYLGEINAVHPFREGNGRTRREFIRELALLAGYRLVWKNQHPERMIRASQLSFVRRDYSELAQILAEAIRVNG